VAPRFFLHFLIFNKVSMTDWRIYMSKNFYAEKMEELNQQVQDLLEKTNQEMITVLDSRIQLQEQNSNISAFLNDAIIKAGEEGTNLAALFDEITSKLKRYVATEPVRIQNTIAGLEERRVAYNGCTDLIMDTKYSIIQHIDKENRIRKAIEDGTINETREIGSRPEKLRDIRNTMPDIKTNTATERFSEENNSAEKGEIAEENI